MTDYEKNEVLKYVYTRLDRLETKIREEEAYAENYSMPRSNLLVNLMDLMDDVLNAK